jgi:P-type conjugative transfer protein TrbJ
MLRLLIITFIVPVAHAQLMNGPCYTLTGACASEPTTLLVKAEVIAHTAKLAAILADAIQNTVRQGGLPSNNLQSELANISVVLQAGQALNQATANLPRQWSETWTPPRAGPGGTDFHAEYSKWSGRTMDTLQAAMMAGQLSHIQQQSIVGVISQIEGILRVVDGRLKAEMTVASSTTRTAASLEKMHNTMLSTSAAHQTWMAYQVQKDIQQHAVEQTFFTPMEVGRDHKGY